MLDLLHGTVFHTISIISVTLVFSSAASKLNYFVEHMSLVLVSTPGRSVNIISIIIIIIISIIIIIISSSIITQTNEEKVTPDHCRLDRERQTDETTYTHPMIVLFEHCAAAVVTQMNQFTP